MRRLVLAIAAFVAAGCAVAQPVTPQTVTPQTVTPVWFPHGAPSGGGGSCPKGTSYTDGCSGAPTASIQHATILNSYGTIPPWNVAGVQYAVGPPTSISSAYKTPGVSSCPSNVTCNSGAHTFTITGSNAVIDGWDFSVGGGWQINCGSGCVNPTITDNNFLAGANAFIALSVTSAASGGGIFSNNIVDGNSAVLDDTGLVIIASSGNWTMDYNWFKRPNEDDVDFIGNSSPTTIEFHFNILENTFGGGHPDWQQVYGTGGYTVNATFNTMIQTLTNAGTQGLGCGDNGLSSTCINVTYTNNTLVLSATQGAAAVSKAFNLPNVPQLSGTITVKDNYIDPTDMSGALCVFAGGTPTKVASGNLNMITGATISC